MDSVNKVLLRVHVCVGRNETEEEKEYMLSSVLGLERKECAVYVALNKPLPCNPF